MKFIFKGLDISFSCPKEFGSCAYICMCISISNYGIKASWKWHPFFSSSVWLLKTPMDLYHFILVIKSDFPPVLLSRQHYQFLNLQKIINYALSRKCECGIPSCQPRAAGSAWWDTFSCLPATRPIVTVTVPLTDRGDRRSK